MPKILARNWKIEIGSALVTPTWTTIKGLNSFTISNDKEDADTTDFDSGGYSEHIVAGRSHDISFEGFYIEETAGARDPGQAAVETAAEKIGAAAILPLRMTSPGGKVRQFNGSFAIGDVGGGINDPTSWGASFTPSGPPVVVAP